MMTEDLSSELVFVEPPSAKILMGCNIWFTFATIRRNFGWGWRGRWLKIFINATCQFIQEKYKLNCFESTRQSWSSFLSFRKMDIHMNVQIYVLLILAAVIATAEVTAKWGLIYTDYNEIMILHLHSIWWKRTWVLTRDLGNLFSF